MTRLGYPIKEAALALGYKSVSPFYEAIYRGEIPAFRIPPDRGQWRIPAKWLDEQIRQQTEKA